ncbi:MAG: hypothetical protein ABFD84_04720 [Candidatus Polarisedimenticolia bacterium]|nr:hypothetical protein [bacterium]
MDELFAERPELLAQARLAPRHRARLILLDVETDERGAVAAVLLGIVRHPKPHPLAPRGDEVLEALVYRPAEGTIEVAASRNLTRRGPPAPPETDDGNASSETGRGGASSETDDGGASRGG